MVFVDANITLELLLPDRPRVPQVAEILGAESDLTISALTGHLVWHFGRRQGLSDQIIAKHAGSYKMLPLYPSDFAWALANERGKDFEDALQVAVALRSGCERFITLDQSLAKRYTHLPLEFVVIV